MKEKNKDKSIVGFSKLSKRGKLKWMVENFFKDPERAMKELMSYWLIDEEKQQILDRFSENTISNFHMPYGVAPNFVVNGETHCIPMVIEESSVVAAASYAAKYWANRGGFHAEVKSMDKLGQIHFTWSGPKSALVSRLGALEDQMRSSAKNLLSNMESRGGGVKQIELVDLTSSEKELYELLSTFNTVDSMGANFMNSVLEDFAETLSVFVYSDEFLQNKGTLEIVMSILSNYTPDCLVKAWVECPIEDLGMVEELSASQFAHKFHKAIRIAKIDPYRATTHNKGIFNGIDAVVIATGNDFRAVEANGHVFAARNGSYQSLSDCSITAGRFKFWIEMPIAVGTVGGLTALHPMAKRSLELLGNPSASELMMIAAAMGLAQNFAAVRSLVTTGIQKGHMRMHLINMLAHLEASDEEAKKALLHFKDKVVSFSAVRAYLNLVRTSSESSPISEQLS
jgi:hydroxymethylglutaryl-CoA reductase